MSERPSIPQFQSLVWEAYRGLGRSLPWRETSDPYLVWLSEMMLQQTQVSRVVSYWNRFRARWPAFPDLAGASLREVLAEWAGLGYNRRARYLLDCAQAVCERHGGALPQDRDQLRALPGIGDYTSGAVMAFAFNQPVVFLDTNIRRVFLTYFFPGQQSIPDSAILPIIGDALDAQRPREWYWALMDLGASLRAGTNANRRSSHYSRQSEFHGSLRQTRGAILRLLTEFPGLSRFELESRLSGMEDRVAGALDALESEGLVAEEAGIYRIP